MELHNFATMRLFVSRHIPLNLFIFSFAITKNKHMKKYLDIIVQQIVLFTVENYTKNS